jgi:hypothetical protein
MRHFCTFSAQELCSHPKALEPKNAIPGKVIFEDRCLAKELRVKPSAAEQGGRIWSAGGNSPHPTRGGMPSFRYTMSNVEAARQKRDISTIGTFTQTSRI